MNVDIWQTFLMVVSEIEEMVKLTNQGYPQKYILSTVVEKDVTHTHTYIMTLRMQVVNYIFAEGENLWLIYNENNESSMYRVHLYV